MKNILFKLAVASPLLIISSTHAATPINLAHPLNERIQLFSANFSSIQTKEIRRHVDFNQTSHIRFQQTYLGYPVWGADAIAHVPKNKNRGLALAGALNQATTAMNGIVYKDLDMDLAKAPPFVFTKSQVNKALQYAISSYQHQTDTHSEIEDPQSQLIVYVDKQNRAHFAFHVSFYVSSNHIPAKPNYILDAQSFNVYKKWNRVKAEQRERENVDGGGDGGNEKTGKIFYDDLPYHMKKLTLQRNDKKQVCYLQNDDVLIKNSKTKDYVEFACKKPNLKHNNVYWNDLDDGKNGGFSPNNDAMFGITAVNQMFKQWYNIAPVTDKDNKPVAITVYTHWSWGANSYWEGLVKGEWRMRLGDGDKSKYPFTTLDSIAHELGHGFTEGHSWLDDENTQAGGLGESFSDMTAQALQYYMFGKNTWLHNQEVVKGKEGAIRYFDKPSKDCHGNDKPGEHCSIDDMSQLGEYTDEHYSAGIFNRAFYLIATANNWDVKKAYDVMVHANMNYWTYETTFADAACGVIKATNDYKYDIKPVLSAFNNVKVDISKC